MLQIPELTSLKYLNIELHIVWVAKIHQVIATREVLTLTSKYYEFNLVIFVGLSNGCPNGSIHVERKGVASVWSVQCYVEDVAFGLSQNVAAL